MYNVPAVPYHTISYHTVQYSGGGVLFPYMGMVRRYRGDDPPFGDLQYDWVPILYLYTKCTHDPIIVDPDFQADCSSNLATSD